MKCWYCGKETMLPRGGAGRAWYSCSECGATWIKVPGLGAPPPRGEGYKETEYFTGKRKKRLIGGKHAKTTNSKTS